jgi:HK97 gp10 family phage protein
VADFSEMHEMVDRLRTFPATIRPLIIGLVDDTMGDAERRAKSRAPVRTGEYQSKIRGLAVVSRGQHQIYGSLEAGAAHSSFIEYGTSRMPPRPIIGEAVEWAALEMEELLALIAEDNL